MTEPITIRLSTPADEPRVRQLAELDSRAAPPGDALLAEIGGRLWAAVDVRDGTAVADPFVRSGQVVELLRARVAQLAA